jgi:hypothetical protein
MNIHSKKLAIGAAAAIAFAVASQASAAPKLLLTSDLAGKAICWNGHSKAVFGRGGIYKAFRQTDGTELTALRGTWSESPIGLITLHHDDGSTATMSITIDGGQLLGSDGWTGSFC